MKIKQQLVESTNLVTEGKNPGKYIAMHETDNTKPTATAQAHADLQSRGNDREVSWHWQVDEVEAIQSFRNDQKCWHAGDGIKGRGLHESIAIEVCVNGDVAKAWENAARLAAHLLKDKDVQASSINDIEQHFNFSGKNCPSQLRAGKHGLSWSKFLDNVNTFLNEGKKESPMPKMASPVEGYVAGRLSEFSRSRRNPATGRVEPHLGLDIAAPKGTRIKAAYAGTVIGVGSGLLPGRSGDRNIYIQNPDGERQYYGHCEKALVTVGQWVDLGEDIAEVGARGNVTGPHLHFEIHTANGVPRNPRIDFNYHGVKVGSKYTGPAPKPAPKPKPKPKPKGRTTADVKAIQRALANMGYDVGPADGDYGNRTAREVENYQRDLNRYAGAGLIEDGDWGPVLQKWFEWVKQLQRALPAWRGVPKLVVDGHYGPRTASAVKILQGNNGLTRDGKAGALTAAYMRKHGSNISNPPKNRP